MVTKFPVLKGIGEKGIFWSHALFNMGAGKQFWECWWKLIFIAKLLQKKKK